MLRFLQFSALIVGSVMVATMAQAAPLKLGKVEVPDKLMKKLKSFEPSSVMYLADLGRYVVSSDDTDKNETPYLFLMDDHGQVDETPMRVQGLPQMTDIESMSQDEHGNLYLLSSLSINKSGANKFSRNLFAKVARRGTALTLLKKVELRSLLIEAIRNSSAAEFKNITANLEKDLDIESHFLVGGNLYVGLKNPQPHPNQALILDLGSVDSLFNNGRIEDLSVWRSVDFSSAGTSCLLSDTQLVDGELYLSSTADNGDPGHLWHLDIGQNKLVMFDTFEHVKPEGLAMRDGDNSLMVVFDQGLEAPLFHMRRRY